MPLESLVGGSWHAQAKKSTIPGKRGRLKQVVQMEAWLSNWAGFTGQSQGASAQLFHGSTAFTESPTHYRLSAPLGWFLVIAAVHPRVWTGRSANQPPTTAGVPVKCYKPLKSGHQLRTISLPLRLSCQTLPFFLIVVCSVKWAKLSGLLPRET